MDYGRYPMAGAPPAPRKGHVKLILMGVGALVVVALGIFLYTKYFATKKITTADNADATNAHTSGTPQVSAAAAGAAALTADSTSTPTGTGSFAPVTAAPSVASSGQATVAASASTVAPPVVAASAPTASPLFVAYKNTSVMGPTKSGLCVDAGGPFDSAALYWCLGSNSQSWNRDANSGQVQVSSTNKCLASSDAAGATGSQVTTKDCDKSDASQLWDWVSGAFKLRGTNQCADSTVLGNGARLNMAPCNAGTPTQTWTT